MTPEIVAEAARREHLRCVVCGKAPPESVVRSWAVALRWICGDCNGCGVMLSGSC